MLIQWKGTTKEEGQHEKIEMTYVSISLTLRARSPEGGVML